MKNGDNNNKIDPDFAIEVLWVVSTGIIAGAVFVVFSINLF